jgi:hypothetical protein
MVIAIGLGLTFVPLVLGVRTRSTSVAADKTAAEAHTTGDPAA